MKPDDSGAALRRKRALLLLVLLALVALAMAWTWSPLRAWLDVDAIVGAIRRAGEDVTIVGISRMALTAEKAAKIQFDTMCSRMSARLVSQKLCLT